MYLFMSGLQSFDGHESFVYLDVDDRVRVHLDQYLHDVTDRCAHLPRLLLWCR
jgi:hypothetical protein